MGEKDIGILTEINKKIESFTKEHNLPFKFETDKGQYQTAIEYSAIGYDHPPKSKSWKELKQKQNEIICPDLLDFEHKLVIEYEEEPKPGKRGKLGKKGHSEESNKDEHRDQLYRIAGFKLLKIWETDLKNNNWEKLYDFLKLEMIGESS